VPVALLGPSVAIATNAAPPTDRSTTNPVSLVALSMNPRATRGPGIKVAISGPGAVTGLIATTFE
jgi:hypothetical protein